MCGGVWGVPVQAGNDCSIFLGHSKSRALLKIAVQWAAHTVFWFLCSPHLMKKVILRVENLENQRNTNVTTHRSNPSCTVALQSTLLPRSKTASEDIKKMTGVYLFFPPFNSAASWQHIRRRIPLLSLWPVSMCFAYVQHVGDVVFKLVDVNTSSWGKCMVLVQWVGQAGVNRVGRTVTHLVFCMCKNWFIRVSLRIPC